MNHACRLVWNEAAARYMPAPETAKGRGKSSGRSAVVVALGAALLGLGRMPIPAAASSGLEGRHHTLMFMGSKCYQKHSFLCPLVLRKRHKTYSK